MSLPTCYRATSRILEVGLVEDQGRVQPFVHLVESDVRCVRNVMWRII